MDIQFDDGYREPMAEVMVVDRLSDQFGGAVEKRRYIVAGDLA